MPDRLLTGGEFAATLDAIGGFEANPVLAVAVSGGPDSMALMLLADRWARQRGGTAWGLTVDHRLRPESAAEARQVGDWLAARGIPHAILAWTGEKPASAIQEEARTARYRLLAGWCQEAGVLHLLSAHHREDQAETFWIRRRAASGPDGLAGMSAVRELPGCRLVRPLLAVPRARLAALLEAEGQPFLSDPSNVDPAYERARLRLGARDSHAAIAQAAGYARSRIAREQALHSVLSRAVGLHPAGFAALDPAALAGTDPETAERLLARVAACIGAARYPARRARLARLRAGLLDQPERARTLGGCRFVPWRSHILVMRELGAAAPPVRLDPGSCVLWDRRFAAMLPADAPGPLTLGYLGGDAGAVEHAEADLPRLLYPILPALFDVAGVAAVPTLAYCRADIAVLPQLRFRPAQPLAQPGFTVV